MIVILTERLKHCLQELMYCVGVFHDVHWLWKSDYFVPIVSAFMTRHCGLILPSVHSTDFPLPILNVSGVFFGYPKYSSVTKMLFDLGLPSFSTLIHNSKESFASRLSVCDNNIVFHECVLFLSVCLSFCVLFFCICCMFYVYLWTSVVGNK